MLRSRLSQAVQRLEFAGGRTEYLFAGALVLIVVAALGLSIYFAFGGRGNDFERPDPNVPYECEACGHHWTVNMEDIDPDRAMASEGPIIEPCPSCGAPDTGYPMTKCPKCGKYFLSEYHRDWQLMGEEGQDELCPHCGLNINEYYRQELEKRKRR